MKTLAFDIYGTVIDTTAVATQLKQLVGSKADLFTQMWRDKQLEYSFRRGLMQDYVSFAVCTAQALDYTDQVLATALSAEDKQALLALYKVLPAFDDVVPALDALKAKDWRLFAFSNGTAEAVKNLLDHAGIAEYFDDIVSVDEIKTFKPNPATYQHFLQRAAANASDTWLISSNPFDILGANKAGLNTAWVQRNLKAAFDPWERSPDQTVTTLTELTRLNQNH